MKAILLALLIALPTTGSALPAQEFLIYQYGSPKQVRSAMAELSEATGLATTDSDGATPLSKAAFYCANVEVIAMLLRSGAKHRDPRNSPHSHPIGKFACRRLTDEIV
jgi:hypothetical protein